MNQQLIQINPAEYLYDIRKLKNLAELSKEYQQNDPIPHIAIDNFLRPDILQRVIADFPAADAPLWVESVTNRAKKKVCSIPPLIPYSIRSVIQELLSPFFIKQLSQITGIPYLIPDVMMTGSGIFCIERGGFLKVHVDFNYHAATRLDRRVNLLLYLNDNWHDSYGGHIEFWKLGQPKPLKTYAPIANRCVIFNTNEDSYHGHPTPLTCPEGRSRNCISIYYYTNGRPKEEQTQPHSTRWLDERTGQILDEAPWPGFAQ